MKLFALLQSFKRLNICAELKGDIMECSAVGQGSLGTDK